jgi:hypothetical protein
VPLPLLPLPLLLLLASSARGRPVVGPFGKKRLRAPGESHPALAALVSLRRGREKAGREKEKGEEEAQKNPRAAESLTGLRLASSHHYR